MSPEQKFALTDEENAV
jgi:2-polyprenyl-3-methyl-5-hydroxy-6-metoxy-1,4-benzoquinol methylase